MMDESLPKPQGFLTSKQEVFTRDTVAMIFGPGGAYKTWFSMFLIGRLARGLDIAGIPTTSCKTLFVSEEMTPPQIRKRALQLFSREDAKQINERMAFRFQANLDFFSRSSVAFNRLHDIITSTNSPDVVVVDALAYLHTGDENSNRDMGIVFGTLKDVAIKTHTCIIIIHHAGKAQELRQGSDRLRGASVMRDLCADMVLIEPTKPRGGRPRSRLEFTKTRNLSEPINPFSFCFEPDPFRNEGVVLTFDRDFDEPDAKSMMQLKAVVEEMAGDGEVLKDGLYLRMTEKEGWGRRKLDEVLAYACKLSMIHRRMRGRQASFFV